jgi:ABC-type glycerol-3-phosphate transport system substrate-binding protein
MKTFFVRRIIFFAVVIFYTGCGNKGSSGPPADQQIVFTHNAGNATQNPGATLAFTVTLTSAMPASGIKMDVSTITEVGGTAVSNSSASGSSASVNMSVTSLPRQVWCVTTVKVSSVGTPSNTATQIFRVVYK